jgi:hypothetical protein
MSRPGEIIVSQSVVYAHLDFWPPIVMSAIAGSATLVGGLIVYCLPSRPSNEVIGSSLAFAAGIYV